MANRRQQRVEELLRRELAKLLLHGELRDPRLSPASAVGITGVEVSADLSVAKVFVDVLSEAVRREDVLAALTSGAGRLRSKLSSRLELRRMPELRFMADEAIARGARVEAILTELRDSGEFEPELPGAEAPAAAQPADTDEGSGGDSGAS